MYYREKPVLRVRPVEGRVGSYVGSSRYANLPCALTSTSGPRPPLTSGHHAPSNGCPAPQRSSGLRCKPRDHTRIFPRKTTGRLRVDHPTVQDGVDGRLERARVWRLEGVMLCLLQAVFTPLNLQVAATIRSLAWSPSFLSLAYILHRCVKRSHTNFTWPNLPVSGSLEAFVSEVGRFSLESQ